MAYTPRPKTVLGMVMYQKIDQLTPMQMTVRRRVVRIHSIMCQIAIIISGKSYTLLDA